MIQIILLLFGADFVRSKAKYLMLSGIFWFMLGAAIFVDGLDGVTYFPVRFFGFLLLLESLVTLSIASSGVGAQKAVLYFKGGLFCFVALLILANKPYSNLLLALIFGFAYFVLGLFVIASAWIVRFPRWKNALVAGMAQLLFAVFMFSPYPTHYQATVSVFLGTLMVLSGINTVRLARRMGNVHEGGAIFTLLAPSERRHGLKAHHRQQPQDDDIIAPVSFAEPLTVHVWTPEATVNTAPVPRPVINRYIAAVDTKGLSLPAMPHWKYRPAYISAFTPRRISIAHRPSFSMFSRQPRITMCRGCSSLTMPLKRPTGVSRTEKYVFISTTARLYGAIGRPIGLPPLIT